VFGIVELLRSGGLTCSSANPCANWRGHWNFAAATVRVLAAPVPEPATWLTTILGFGGIGLALRRRPQTLVPSSV
jgi:hypothetical protein